jgi:methylglyoxal reductase
MIYREIGASELQATVIGLGAWAIGGWMWGGQEDSQSIRAVHAALDAGINFIDTAPIYGFGRSEQVIGKAIKGRRDEVVLATKCGLHWEGNEPRQGAYHFSSDEHGIQSKENATRDVYRYLSGDAIRKEVEASLRRLGVETIDLYQTHWQDPTTHIEETMSTLVRLRDEGKIRAIGASNATVEHLIEYRKVGRLDADQELYNMLDRKLESSNLPYCAKHNIAFLAYSPLANGLLTGKIGPDRKFGKGDLRARNPRFSKENLSKIQGMLDQIRPLAEKRNLTLPQLVTAWTLARPGVTHVLVGIRSEEQARDNAAAGAVELEQEEIETIDRVLES